MQQIKRRHTSDQRREVAGALRLRREGSYGRLSNSTNTLFFVARAAKRSTICKLRPHEKKKASPLLEEVVPDAPLLAAVVAEEFHAREVKGAPPVEPELRFTRRVGLL